MILRAYLLFIERCLERVIVIELLRDHLRHYAICHVTTAPIDLIFFAPLLTFDTSLVAPMLLGAYFSLVPFSIIIFMLL